MTSQKVCMALVWLAVALLPVADGLAGTPPHLEGLLACRGIPEAGARLECFDRESASLAVAPVAASPAPAMPPEKAFGLPPLAVAEAQASRIEQPASLESLTGRVVGLSLGENGRVVVTLDNGQVWRQLMAGEDLNLKLGDTVRLTRGIVGSYFMKVPSGRTCKVNRLR